METLNLKGTQTATNLMKAFAGESQAYQRYMLFAETARREGYMKMAEIFELTAANEQAHAKRFYMFLVKYHKVLPAESHLYLPQSEIRCRHWYRR